MALRVDTGTLWRTVKEPKVKRSSSTDDISSDARSTHERVGDSSTRVNGEGCSQPRSDDVESWRQVGDELLVGVVFNLVLIL